MGIIWDHLKLKTHEAREKMNDIKDYRNNELKNYVIGNILLVLYFSGIFDNFFTSDVNGNLNIWKTLIESALVSSIIYIYVFLLDSLIPGNIKQKVAYFHIGKLPGYTIFTKMKQNEYYGAAEPPVRCGESHLSGLTEPPHFFIKLLCEPMKLFL